MDNDEMALDLINEYEDLSKNIIAALNKMDAEIVELKRRIQKDEAYFSVICDALNIGINSNLTDILIEIDNRN